jgi:hypothetical protein
MTALTASDASTRAHARFYPCMRCDGEGLPKPQSSPLECDLRIEDWFQWLWGQRNQPQPQYRGFSLIPRHPQRAEHEERDRNRTRRLNRSVGWTLASMAFALPGPVDSILLLVLAVCQLGYKPH